MQTRAGGGADPRRQIGERVGMVRSTACRRSRPRRVRARAIVAVAPRAVRLETMTTGIGRSRIIFSRNSRPFIFGISTSSVITSGLSALIASRASSGSAASPTTSMSGSRAQRQPRSGRAWWRNRRRRGRGPASCAASVLEPIGRSTPAADEARRRGPGHAFGMADVEPAARRELGGEPAPHRSAASARRNR